MAPERSAIADGVPEGTDPASAPEETGPAALVPGTRIAGYELGRRLGVGSMGAVYAGARAADGKPVAIKVLAAELAEKPTARARFLNEATLTARVSHPHAVAVIDSGEAPEGVYLVMDLLEGEDLARRLHRAGAMSVGEASEILVPICDALAAAHRAGVTHRDLKPSNIFLAVREGHPHPMLLDFGVATDEGGTDAGTGDGDAPGPTTWNGVGTPMYLAPELVADHRAAGPASDQYALGAILYETLTGEPPYAADNLQQLLQTIAAGKPPSARGRRPELPPKLDALVLRAMSADPRERFPSVEELGLALGAFAVAPETTDQERRRPASSPAIAAEAATPSPFVRTLVPEHEAKSGPWFVAPDADEIPEEERELFEDDDLGADPVSGEAQSPTLADEGSGRQEESPPPGSVSPRLEDAHRETEDVNLSIEVATAPLEGDDRAEGTPRRKESSPSAPARTLPAIDWPAVSAFATKHRRILVSSGIALVGIVVLFAILGGRSGSRPVSVPPAALTVTAGTPPAVPAAAEKVEPAPAPPPAPAAAEKIEPAPAVEKAPSTPAAPPAPGVRKSAIAASSSLGESEPTPVRAAAAPATIEKNEVAPRREGAAAPFSTGTDTSRERPKTAARRERPSPARAESPPPKVTAPAPAPKARATESVPVRMHNGVPLLD